MGVITGFLTTVVRMLLITRINKNASIRTPAFDSTIGVFLITDK